MKKLIRLCFSLLLLSGCDQKTDARYEFSALQNSTCAFMLDRFSGELYAWCGQKDGSIKNWRLVASLPQPTGRIFDEADFDPIEGENAAKDK